ncbi:MAG TPA: plastocyanin/azurin family copper-binding protein [Anaeromyxobacteraceae bacterium]|jgi:plastocyanin|nr:plastocyanin/azurin family copper-binding protein [Anaeromyxobacteraceae bacterium]
MSHLGRLTFRLLTLALGVVTATAALAEGGTITGKVDATPAKYLAETVVYLKSVPGAHPPKTHNLDQKGMTFLPHLLIVTAGDTVKFLNHDGVGHNVYSPDNEGYNLGTFKQNEERTYTFAKPGVYSQLCSIHPEMLGYVFVGQNPYAAAVDAKGSFTIKGVPPGTYQLAVWNSHLKAPEKSVTVAAGKTLEERLTVKR